MKRIVFAALILAISGINQFSMAQAPALSWQKCLGGSDDDWSDSNTGILKLKNGDYVVWGQSKLSDGTFPINKGGYDAFVVKLDKKGNIIWKKTYGGSGDENLWGALELKNGDLLVTGKTSSNDGDVSGNHGEEDLWLLRLSPNGNLISQHCYGGSGNEGNFANLTQYNDDFIIASLTSSNDGDVSGNHGGNYDGWVLRINGSGSIVWAKCVGGLGSDVLMGTVAVINNVIVVGGGTNSPDGNTNFHDGLGGGVDPYGFPDGDPMIVRMTLDGTLLSARCYGGSSGDGYHSFAETSDGNIVITVVNFSQDGDVTHTPGANLFMWVAKISLTTGDVMWDWSSPETDLTAGFGIIPTRDGGFVSVGAIAPTFDWADWDGYAVKLGAAGNQIWSVRLGGSDGEQLDNLVEAKSGDLAIMGISSSNDGDVSGNHGGPEDSWLVGLSEHGRPIEARIAASNSSFSVYPNPISGIATFSFSLSESERISIEIVDATGRLVHTVCNSNYEKGSHEISWNAASVASGSYFVKFRSTRINENRSIVILK